MVAETDFRVIYSVPPDRWVTESGRRQEILRAVVDGRNHNAVTGVLRIDDEGYGSLQVKGSNGRRMYIGHVEFESTGDAGHAKTAIHNDASVIPVADGGKSNSRKTKIFRHDIRKPLFDALVYTATMLCSDQPLYHEGATAVESMNDDIRLERLGIGPYHVAKEGYPVARGLMHIAGQVYSAQN